MSLVFYGRQIIWKPLRPMPPPVTAATAAFGEWRPPSVPRLRPIANGATCQCRDCGPCSDRRSAKQLAAGLVGGTSYSTASAWRCQVRTRRVHALCRRSTRAPCAMGPSHPPSDPRHRTRSWHTRSASERLPHG